MLIQSIGETKFPLPDSPYLQKPISLVDSTFGLYGFLPVDNDPRWSFLKKYDDVKRTVGFQALNFANAYGATYLSTEVSYHTGFVTSFIEENNLQLDRALDNLEHVSAVTERYDTTNEEYEGFDMQFVLTDRLTSDPTKSEGPITPCPEALYQVRLYDGQYIARVGFNLHDEDGSTVLSIVNIQGTPSGSKRNADFEAAFSISPFNLLIKRTLSIAGAFDPAYKVRGMINPIRGNSQLYWGVLEQEGVDMYHAQRKDAKQGSVG